MGRGKGLACAMVLILPWLPGCRRMLVVLVRGCCGSRVSLPLFDAQAAPEAIISSTFLSLLNKHQVGWSGE